MIIMLTYIYLSLSRVSFCIFNFLGFPFGNQKEISDGNDDES